MFDLVSEIAQTLRNNKLRTALTGFAVAWGIFLLIVLLGMSKGVVNSFEAGQTPEATSSMTVWGGWTTKPFQGYKEGRSIKLENADIEAISARNRQQVRSVGARKSIDTATVATQLDYITGGLSGVYPAEGKTHRFESMQGRFINEADMAQARKVVVMEEANAVQLFGSADKAVGARVKSMGLSWLIVGVYKHPWENATYIPFTTALQLSGNDGVVNELTVMARDLKTEADGSALENSVRESLSRTHHFDKADEGAVHIWNRFNNYLANQGAMGILDTSVWVLGVLTLLSGIVGVSNIMFVSVRERTHEIGIRRAIGAKPRSIMMQVVAESVAITTLFGYIGVVAGMGVTELLGHLFSGANGLKDPGVDLSVALEVTIVLIISGALAGLFPAVKATKVRPVEALRYE
ncbi:MAG: ABC transporter permease [Muribaculaceae bacterium]|nr:ABC transporter permease [Muribaculaceae bacterium]